MDRIAHLLHGRRNRRRAATLRLCAARIRFDRSAAAVRRAARDHIDGHAVAGTRLRMALARLSALAGTA
ncbi:hypothetical protein ASF60_00235 [Methylobacterium sp. Leaf113]|uniref:hypothetical protein n=1 Tax=Methylobacterium sp. Leaf113 TaxID=1736259 RepID=UPI0006F2D530|nr:hypothetical protein [Methylobacterium sp. Leaf113]KQP94686.1 hypothetical protein ASF60_00235 [Methylobacterium sp. Leaf113]